MLTVLAAADKPVRYLAGRAMWQAAAVYRGGEAKTDAKNARVIADQSRMRGADLPVLAPDDDLITDAGLAPAPRDTGKGTGRLHTPQRYSRRLRRVMYMYMSALTAIRCDPQSRAYDQSKRDDGKKSIQATICPARRRTNVLYALIHDHHTWQPDPPPISESAA